MLVFILRNPVSVVESAQTRFDNPEDRFDIDGLSVLDRWNKSLQAVSGAIDEGHKVIVSNETLFSSRESIDALYQALDLDPAKANAARVKSVLRGAETVQTKPVPRNEALRRDACLRADFDTYRRLTEPACILREAA